MKSKLRISIIVAILCLMVLCSVIALAAVFAANVQNFSSNVSVSFKAPGITGKVSANYYIGAQDKTGTPMTTDGTASGAKELIFKASESSANGALNPQGDIELTLENNFVVFEYIFQNGLGEPVTEDFVAELSLNASTTNNIKMTTKQSKEKLTDFNMIVSEVESTTGDDKGWMFVEHNEEGNLISTKYFYVKAEVENTSIDASFSGNFNWELSIAKPTLDALTFTFIDEEYYGYECYSVKLNKPVAASTNIIIPKTYTGEDGVERPVTVIVGDGYEECNFNGYIYIPDSIIYINDYAFCSCDAIKGELIIPDSVLYIENGAFVSSSIQSVVIEGFQERLNGFPGCSIQSLTIEEDVADIVSNGFDGCSIQSLIIGKKVSSIYESILLNLKSGNYLENIHVNTANETYTSRDNSGKECNVLIEKNNKRIIKGAINSIIPTDDSVTKIGKDAFRLVAIQTIVVPDNIIEIEREAFQSSPITSVKIGSISSIGKFAFYRCYELTEVIIDGQTVCENLMSWETGDIHTYLIENATTIKAKYEIVGIENYIELDGNSPRKFTKSTSQDADGYWIYTYTN